MSQTIKQKLTSFILGNDILLDDIRNELRTADLHSDRNEVENLLAYLKAPLLGHEDDLEVMTRMLDVFELLFPLYAADSAASRLWLHALLDMPDPIAIALQVQALLASALGSSSKTEFAELFVAEYLHRHRERPGNVLFQALRTARNEEAGTMIIQTVLKCLPQAELQAASINLLLRLFSEGNETYDKLDPEAVVVAVLENMQTSETLAVRLLSCMVLKFGHQLDSLLERLLDTFFECSSRFILAEADKDLPDSSPEAPPVPIAIREHEDIRQLRSALKEMFFQLYTIWPAMLLEHARRMVSKAFQVDAWMDWLMFVSLGCRIHPVLLTGHPDKSAEINLIQGPDHERSDSNCFPADDSLLLAELAFERLCRKQCDRQLSNWSHERLSNLESRSQQRQLSFIHQRSELQQWKDLAARERAEYQQIKDKYQRWEQELNNKLKQSRDETKLLQTEVQRLQQQLAVTGHDQKETLEHFQTIFAELQRLKQQFVTEAQRSHE